MLAHQVLYFIWSSDFLSHFIQNLCLLRKFPKTDSGCTHLNAVVHHSFLSLCHQDLLFYMASFRNDTASTQRSSKHQHSSAFHSSKCASVYMLISFSSLISFFAGSSVSQYLVICEKVGLEQRHKLSLPSLFCSLL